jgi:hypothetical protein
MVALAPILVAVDLVYTAVFQANEMPSRQA